MSAGIIFLPKFRSFYAKIQYFSVNLGHANMVLATIFRHQFIEEKIEASESLVVVTVTC